MLRNASKVIVKKSESVLLYFGFYSFLADNIKKLKDESRAKERKIANLQKTMRKGYYY